MYVNSIISNNTSNKTETELGKSILFVSGNVNKVKEVKAILQKYVPDILIDNLKIDLPEFQEEMIEIGKLKALHAYDVAKKPVIVEDTSLCFEALNGMPGPYIKWFGTFTGKYSFGGLRKMLVGFDNFEAEAVTVFSFYDGGVKMASESPLVFVGRVKGLIVEPRGSNEFGWDAVFQPHEADGRTFGEMRSEEKNLISHRFRGLDLLGRYLHNEYFI